MSDYNYEKNNCTRVSIKLGNKTDADIIDRLNNQDNKQGYIKTLIRRDIERDKAVEQLNALYGVGVGGYILAK